MNRHIVKLLVQVNAPSNITPKEVADTVNTLINAGLSDAADSVELKQEDQIINPTIALDLNIYSPKIIHNI